MFSPGKIQLCFICSCSVSGLQCYGCNIIVGTKYVDTGCSNPEVITCSHSHQGFKHRFCIKTESGESALWQGCHGGGEADQTSPKQTPQSSQPPSLMFCHLLALQWSWASC